MTTVSAHNMFFPVRLLGPMSHRLETDKAELLSQVDKLQNEQETWDLQKSELQMSQAELEAENQEMRAKVQAGKELVSSEASPSEEMKSELSKVWDMLRIKVSLYTVLRTGVVVVVVVVVFCFSSP